MYVCMYSYLPSLYLKLHVVHEITVPYMALFRSHYLIKKKKLVYCNVFGMMSPSVFRINVFFFFFNKRKP